MDMASTVGYGLDAGQVAAGFKKLRCKVWTRVPGRLTAGIRIRRPWHFFQIRNNPQKKLQGIPANSDGATGNSPASGAWHCPCGETLSRRGVTPRRDSQHSPESGADS
mgnify:CR=1 FL=1